MSLLEPFPVIFRDLALSPEESWGPLLTEALCPSSCYHQSFFSALYLTLPLIERTSVSVPAVPVTVLSRSCLLCQQGLRLLLWSSTDVSSMQWQVETAVMGAARVRGRH